MQTIAQELLHHEIICTTQAWADICSDIPIDSLLETAKEIKLETAKEIKLALNDINWDAWTIHQDYTGVDVLDAFSRYSKFFNRGTVELLWTELLESFDTRDPAEYHKLFVVAFRNRLSVGGRLSDAFVNCFSEILGRGKARIVTWPQYMHINFQDQKPHYIS